MTFREKIESLNSLIEEVLTPLIDNDYVLWECPYYCNIGDILIWEGELEFLKKVNYKRLGINSMDTCNFPELSAETIILLQGGGNFGDFWRTAQDFRLKVCQRYPSNRIIIFPQTIFYEEKRLLDADAQIMSEHKDLTICVRDTSSYQLVKQHFKNKVLLLPDMAFCISQERLKPFLKTEGKKNLLLKRVDKEMATCPLNTFSDIETDISDWPTYEKKDFATLLFDKANQINRYISRTSFLFMIRPLSNRIINYWAITVYRRHLLKVGVNFLSGYKVLYTTRLHVLILGILLHKKCVVIDNFYGKNSSFYATWLEDLENVSMFSGSEKL